MRIIISTIRININQNLSVYSEGSKFSNNRNQYHGIDGPACEYENGDESWRFEDDYHRKYGPAWNRRDNDRWWFEGKLYSRKKFMDKFL